MKKWNRGWGKRAKEKEKRKKKKEKRKKKKEKKKKKKQSSHNTSRAVRPRGAAVPLSMVEAMERRLAFPLLLRRLTGPAEGFSNEFFRRSLEEMRRDSFRRELVLLLLSCGRAGPMCACSLFK